MLLSDVVSPASLVARPWSHRLGRREMLRLLAAAGAAVAGAPALGRAAAQEATPPALGLQADGTRVWRVLVAGGSDADLIEFNTFFPKELTINAGDTVLFEFKGLHAPHTVTFLSGQEAPQLIVPADPEGTPAAGGPPALMFNPAAAFSAGGPAYDGSGILNSGLNVLLQPGQFFAPTFTTPGTYDYLCLVHPMMMKGTLTVQEAGAAVPHEQEEVDAIAADEMAMQIDLGRALAAEHGGTATPTAGADGGTVWDVLAGDEGDEFVLLRYFPDPLTIKAGDTVRWTDRSKMEPHTVTFLGGEAPPDLIVPEPQEAGPPKLLFNPAVVAPAGPQVYSGQGYANSGAMGADFEVYTGLTTYELTFDTPGEYPYFCALHGSPTMGMRATITVT